MCMDKIRSKAKPFTLSTYHPMQTLMIDYIEDLHEDDLGNRHIAVVVDCFSRYCTLHATKTTKSSELARSLLSHVSILAYLTTLSQTRVQPLRAMSLKT